MRREPNENFEMTIDESVNEIIEETAGNKFIALRKVSWRRGGSPKLDLRNWFVGSDGDEIAGKGVSFPTDAAADNLVAALLKHGYGDTRNTLEAISDREDFAIAVKEIIEDKEIDLDSVEIPKMDDIEPKQFYDPKSII